MRLRLTLLTTIGLALGLGAVASASVLDRPYDFTDAYYTANGINPLKLGGRKQAPSASAVIDTPNFAFQRNVRVIGTSCGYDASGHISFVTVMAGFGPDGFTNDAAGAKAKQLAEKYAEYIFPSQGADPVGLGGARQSVVLDTSNGYFSNNPLNLWLHVFVNFTPKAFNTADGQKALADLRKSNGTAKDGTPIIKTKSEIDNLFSKGFVNKLTRNDGLRYAVCPIIKDPTNGGIAPDATLSFIKLADGTPLEPAFVTAFNNLKTLGTWDDRP